MKSSYHIIGMTCMGCQKTVSEKINTIAGVEAVDVALDSGLAVIQSKRSLTLEELSQALGTKYVVSDIPQDNPMAKNSKLKQLTPLFLIFIYLIVGTLFLSHQLQVGPERGMQIFMGLFFIVFSFFKFLDYKGFPDSFKRYDPLAKRIPAYASFYPFLETALGIAFLGSWQLPIVLSITLGVLSFTTFGVLRALVQKAEIECACLGTVLKLPMTEATLIENGIMLIMASILLAGYLL
jgi:copper chaperone CopZ